MRLVLVGPPGAGKGTQAEVLADRFDVPAISTGDIFRRNVAGGTELGRRAKTYMDDGDLVPDDVVVGMVRDRLDEDDAAGGFLLDGFPRTCPQAEELAGVLDERGLALDAVVQLEVPAEEIVRRLASRRDEAGRGDDDEQVVRNRLRVYDEQTAPVVGWYDERDLLVRVDAHAEVDEVTERVVEALQRRRG